MMVSLRKNDVHTLEIVDLTHDGAGVGKVVGMSVFIPGALVGEWVECCIIQLKSRYAIGKLLRVITASPDRVAPPCSVYGRCGGCQLQHMAYGAQLSWKQSLVQRHIHHIGKSDMAVNFPMGMDHDVLSTTPKAPFWHYRHKAILPFGRAKTGEPVLGFYAPHSHRVVPLTDCLIQAGPFAEIVATTVDCVREAGLSVYDEATHKGLLRALIMRRSATTGKVVLGISLNAKNAAMLSRWADKMKTLPDIQGVFLCQNMGRNNVPLSGAIVALWGDLVLRETLGDISFALGPLSFFQVNPIQAARIVAHLKGLYRQLLRPALDAKAMLVDNPSVSLSESKPTPVDPPSLLGSTGRQPFEITSILSAKLREPIIWDLYAGVGTMGLVFAREASQVVCVEIVPEAAALCRQNADDNGLQNVHVIEGPLEACLDQLASLPLPDVVILDPPRQGCHAAVLAFLNQRRIPHIWYVSCDSATFARDSEVLAAQYTCTDLQPIDMFPMTRHIEVMGCFNPKILHVSK
jgi:23S rRNA (uracil1939-C5)-methyltransferase